MKEFLSKSEKQTKNWAGKFIKNKNDACILLKGKMGAGKTVIVKGFAEKLGVNERVNSPTFTLINEYKGKVPMYHFDLYRLEKSEELYNLGLEEYLQAQGIKVFEWPEKFNVFPEDSYNIHVEIIDENTRRISLT